MSDQPDETEKEPDLRSGPRDKPVKPPQFDAQDKSDKTTGQGTTENGPEK
jgi:hypothetical protein